MNYILQLSGFFQKVAADNRLNPTHVSLYMAIFQFWNANHFHNPVSISRQELMKISKISAKATYHKCIKDLHTFGYIQYMPSFNTFKGSLVYLSDLQSGARPLPVLDHTNIETRIEQAIAPYINNTNSLNENEENNTSSKNDIVVKVTKHKTVVIEANGKPVPANAPAPQLREESQVPGGVVIPSALNESAGDKRSPNRLHSGNERVKRSPNRSSSQIPPTQDDVRSYFSEQNSSETEATKFYNYFQSNGWKVGGKTPMQDWQAAARNWMLNATQFSRSSNNAQVQTPPIVDTATAKDYSEPL
jgi:hypothetical protein